MSRRPSTRPFHIFTTWVEGLDMKEDRQTIKALRAEDALFEAIYPDASSFDLRVKACPGEFCMFPLGPHEKGSSAGGGS